MSNDITAEDSLWLRREKEARHYEVHLRKDPWDEWVLTRIRRGPPIGQVNCLG
jgi:hypothetical protein